MKKLYIIFFVFFICVFNIFGKSNPRVEKGVIDLSGWSFEENGNVSLNGDWEFYWNKFIEPQDFKIGKIKVEEYGDVPNSWRNYSKKHPSFGYGTFRTQIKLPTSNAALAFRIKNAGSTYKVFINGEELAEAGKVSKEALTEKPLSTERIVYFKSETKVADVVLFVSNYTFSNAGLWTAIEMGNIVNISKRVNKDNLKESFIIGCLVIMGLYHICMFLLRREERSVLFFGLFCLATAFRSLFASVGIYSVIPESFDFQWKIRLELIAYFLSGIFFIVYTGYMYKKEFSRKVINGAYFMGILFTVLQLIFPVYIIDNYLLIYYHIWIILTGVYLIYVVFSAFVKKTTSSGYMILFLLMFLGTVVNDILNGLSVIHTIYLVPLGLVIFIFGQAFIIAERYSEAVNAKEKLTSELADSNYELKDTIEKLHQSQEHLVKSEKLAVIGKLAGNITHEIKNPLGAIMTNIQSIKMDLEDADITPIETKESLIESAEIIEIASKQARNVIMNMLDYSRMDKDDMMNIDLNKTVNSSVLLMKKELANLNIEVNVEMNEKEMFIKGNSGELAQVVLNLLINSRDAIVEKNRGEKRINVKTYKENEKAVLEIKDTGTGIARENIDKIFEMYYTTKEKGKGTGIGMSVVKSIIDKHKGEMEIESEVGEYTRFKFSF